MSLSNNPYTETIRGESNLDILTVATNKLRFIENRVHKAEEAQNSLAMASAMGDLADLDNLLTAWKDQLSK